MKGEILIFRTRRSMKENDGEKSGTLTHDIVSKAMEITRTKNGGKREESFKY